MTTLMLILLMSGIYAVKGGQLGHIDEVAEWRKEHWILNRILDGKVLSTLLFCLLIGVLTGTESGVNELTGTPSYIFDWTIVFLAAVGWLQGVAPGLGVYVAQMLGNTNHGDTEWEPIDQIIEPTRKYGGRVWGATGLVFRGMLTTYGLAMLFQSPLFLLIGATMPICYYVGHYATQALKKVGFPVWISELLYGAVLGYGLSLAI